MRVNSFFGSMIACLGLALSFESSTSAEEPTLDLRETLQRFAFGIDETRPGDEELLYTAKCQQMLGYDVDALKTLGLIRWKDSETEIPQNETDRRYEITVTKDKMFQSLVGPLLDASRSGDAVLAARSISNEIMRNRELARIVHRQAYAARAYSAGEYEPVMLLKAAKTVQLLPEDLRAERYSDIACQYALRDPAKALEMVDSGLTAEYAFRVLAAICEGRRTQFMSLEEQTLVRRALDKMPPGSRPRIINLMTLGDRDKLKTDPVKWKFHTDLIRGVVDYFVSIKNTGTLDQYHWIFLRKTYLANMTEENARLLETIKSMIPHEKTPFKRSDALWSLLYFVHESCPEDVIQSDELLQRIFIEVTQIPVNDRAGFFWRILSVPSLTDEQFARCVDFYRELLVDASEKDYPKNIMAVLEKSRLDPARRKEIVLESLTRGAPQEYSSNISGLLGNLVRNDMADTAFELVLSENFPDDWREHAIYDLARDMTNINPTREKGRQIAALLDLVKNPEWKFDILMHMAESGRKFETKSLPDPAEMRALAMEIFDSTRRFESLCRLVDHCRKNKIEFDLEPAAVEFRRIIEQDSPSRDRLNRIIGLLSRNHRKDYPQLYDAEGESALVGLAEETLDTMRDPSAFSKRLMFADFIDRHETDVAKRQKRREASVEKLLNAARKSKETVGRADAYYRTANLAMKFGLTEQARRIAVEGLEFADSLTDFGKNEFSFRNSRNGLLRLCKERSRPQPAP